MLQFPQNEAILFCLVTSTYIWRRGRSSPLGREAR
nr:MAG TPA: hypothetical protein [Caudoviricetes sp.]